MWGWGVCGLGFDGVCWMWFRWGFGSIAIRIYSYYLLETLVPVYFATVTTQPITWPRWAWLLRTLQMRVPVGLVSWYLGTSILACNFLFPQSGLVCFGVDSARWHVAVEQSQR